MTGKRQENTSRTLLCVKTRIQFFPDQILYCCLTKLCLQCLQIKKNLCLFTNRLCYSSLSLVSYTLLLVQMPSKSNKKKLHDVLDESRIPQYDQFFPTLQSNVAPTQKTRCFFKCSHSNLIINLIFFLIDLNLFILRTFFSIIFCNRRWFNVFFTCRNLDMYNLSINHVFINVSANMLL